MRGGVIGHEVAQETTCVLHPHGVDDESENFPADWQEDLAVCAGAASTGNTNPSDLCHLSRLQAVRTVTFELEATSTFRVLLSISRCCTTGRNFLFSGHTPGIHPPCPVRSATITGHPRWRVGERTPVPDELLHAFPASPLPGVLSEF